MTLRRYCYQKKMPENHGIDVDFLELDILEQTPMIGKVDFVVSNPPYVPHGDRGQMDSRVKRL